MTEQNNRTNPTENFRTSPFGFGPFPPSGFQGVFAPSPYPDYAGFGGVAWATLPIPDPVPLGGAYGLSPYGGVIHPVPTPPSPAVPEPGGFGSDPFGLSPFGTGESGVGEVTGALSLNGYEIEVFFSVPIDTSDPSLYLMTSYTLTSLLGAAPATILSVRSESLGFGVGSSVSSVILLHTGTTLGGSYRVSVTGPGGLVNSTADCLTKGEPPTYVIQAIDGEDLVITFSDPMLEDTGASVGNSGITDPDSYEFTSDPDYPIQITPLDITHPYQSDLHKVHMSVKGMTSLQYTCNITPSLAFDYTCSELPNEDPQLNGIEINSAQGESYINDGYLWMSKLRYRVYGWSFLDISGRVLPDVTTFKASLTLNAAGATYNPPLNAFTSLEVAYLVFEDGPAGTGIRVRVGLTRQTGMDYLRVQCGTFDESVRQIWSTGSVELSLVRNLKAGTYSILLDGLPVVTALIEDFDGVAEGSGAGVSCILSGDGFDVSGFRVQETKFSATSTVYSGSWNFLHDTESAPFTGSAALTRDHIMTQRGPVVKSWGDATPATKQDVEVLIAGTAVGVKDVNPYLGEIWPTYPIPLLPSDDPQADVKVNYYWMASPIMEMAGLNTPGLVLNQWDRQAGHTDPAAHGQPPGSPLYIPTQPAQSTPFEDDEFPVRFPMGTVLGPMERPTPLQIGHRYIGFEREYSALLNDPTSLLLNQDPYQTAVDGFSRTMTGVSVAYEGTKTPLVETPVWALEGQDSGWVDVGEGTYTLIDALPSEFEPDARTVAMYYREVDFTFPAALTINSRLIVESYTLNGVDTGVGFGIHDNHSLYQVGLLVINGIRHLGMLIDPKKPELYESWDLGPKAASSVIGKNTISIVTDLVPIDFQSGMKFQVFDHAQAGVYTATSVISLCDGSTTVTVAEDFPADWDLYEQDNPEVVFEVSWDEHPLTYRFVVDMDRQIASLEIAGEISATVLELNGSTNPWPAPSESALVLDIEGKGQVFWGSLSYLAANQTKWSFFRYGVIPDFTALNVPAIVVPTEMNDLPTDNPQYPWFTTQSFGSALIDQTGDVLVLKSPVASDTLDYTFGYSRIEPFVNESAGIDIRSEFRLDSGVLGAGDAEIVINNGAREIRLATLLYAENFPGLEWRRLVTIPSISMAGIQDPNQQGWSIVSGSTGTVLRSEYDLIITQGAGQTQRYTQSIDTTDFTVDSGYRIAEAQFEVDSYTTDANGNTGIVFQADIGPNRWFGLRLKDDGVTPAIQLVNQVDAVVHEYNFDWADGEVHTYRVVGALGVLSVFIDDVLMTPTLNIDLFLGGAGTDTFLFGATNLISSVVSSTLASVVRWRTISYHPTAAPQCLRTLGIWKGGDKNHINSWEIPRIDNSSASNSAHVGPDIVVMNWMQNQEVRLLLNPDWGVTMYRPDLPYPPYYQPESDVAGTGFINQTNEPSAGWINVQYSELPYVPKDFGSIEFGSFDPRSITQQRWDWVRYRIFKALTNDYIAPQHMVLNYANVITSGELTKDSTLENVVVQTIDNRRVSLLPTHLYADDIYKIVDGDTIYTSESWTFDPESQLITLGQDADYNNLYFSGDHVPVNIIFQPGKPVTNTYLEGQPLAEGVTKLNEGTPPIPMNQANGIDKRVTYKDLLNDPNDPLNNGGALTLNDPYRVLDHEVDAETLYESMEFINVTNGGLTGLIAIAGEGTLPEGFSGYSETEGKAVGAHVLDFSGTKFWEGLQFPKPDSFEQGGGAPGQTLFCSGGNYMGPAAVNTAPSIGAPDTWKAGLMQPLGGVLGPGSAVLHPNYPSGCVTRGNDGGKTNRSTEWYMRIGSIAHTEESGSITTDTPFTETVRWPLMDNTPPSRPPEYNPNPSGTPNPNQTGACLAVTTSAGDYSHIGPWGGMDALEAKPDTGFFEIRGVLVDGTQVTVKEEVSGDFAVFTARTVPVGPDDFAISPQPHVSLASAINNNPIVSLYVTADAGLTLAAVEAVQITSLDPVTLTNIVVIETSDSAIIRLTGVDMDALGVGTLTGGAKIKQSSLLAGGDSTIKDGIHDPLLGMVCQGGQVLPVGTQVSSIIYASTGV